MISYMHMVDFVTNTVENLAAVYGQGQYSGGTYNNGVLVTSSGGLADTGVAIAGVATIACFIVFAALVVRFWRRRQRMQLGTKRA